MLMKKGFKTWLIAAILLLAMGTVSFASSVPDVSVKGSIKLQMLYEEKAVSGGSLEMYQVGEIGEIDGNFFYVLTMDFAASRESLQNIASLELAKNLAKYAKENKLSGAKTEIDANGAAVYTDVTPGLYLVMQDQAAKGYETIVPFLVSVPVLENDVWVYDVDATPKMEPVKKAKETESESEKETETEKETESETDKTPGGGKTPGGSKGGTGTKLPQTGQMKWPIPILAVSGTGIFAAGWAMCLGKRKEDHEK